MVLEIAALTVSIVALVIAATTIWWQMKQGARIGLSVISTVDQIYRRLRSGGYEGEEEAEYYADWFPDVSKRYIKRGKSVMLSLSGWPSAHILGVPWEIICIVEGPLGRRFRCVKIIESEMIKARDMVEHRLIFPNEFDRASTQEPGRYHVWWRGREAVEINGHSQRVYTLAEDAFGVLP